MLLNKRDLRDAAVWILASSPPFPASALFSEGSTQSLNEKWLSRVMRFLRVGPRMPAMLAALDNDAHTTICAFVLQTAWSE